MRKFARTLSAALLSGCLLAGTAAPGFSALAADTELPVWPKNDTLKVLAIGNSFSEDAMRWMYDIALTAAQKTWCLPICISAAVPWSGM